MSGILSRHVNAAPAHHAAASAAAVSELELYPCSDGVIAVCVGLAYVLESVRHAVRLGFAGRVS